MENNDISGALSKLLSDPDALAKAMSIASSLMSSMPTVANASESQPSPPTETESVLAAPVSGEAHHGEGTPNAATSSIDADVPSVAAIVQLLGGGGASNKGDPRCALLYALKPYMGHGRDEKIDTLVNMLRLAQLASGMFGDKPH